MELVHGGGMVLTFIGRLENEQPMPSLSLLGMALHDMVLEVHYIYTSIYIYIAWIIYTILNSLQMYLSILYLTK